MDSNTGFPFEQALAKQGMSFICEVKKASPSKGLIAAEFPYVQIAREYEAAGADAISVLTEPAYFQGKNEYLTEIRQAVKIPLLRKDFKMCIRDRYRSNLSIFILAEIRFHSMENSQRAGSNGSCGQCRIHTLACCLTTDEFHILVLNKVIERTHGMKSYFRCV